MKYRQRYDPATLIAAGVLGGGSTPLVYLWKDDFTTAESAPLASPRTMEPGPETLIITDTGNDLSITSNGLVNSGASPVGDDPQIRVTNTFARVAGRCAYFKIYIPTSGVRDNSGITLGWNDDTSFSSASKQIFFNTNRTAGFCVEGNFGGAGAQIVPWSFNTSYVLAVVLRVQGAHYLVKGGAYTDWKLVYTTRSITTTPLYAGRTGGNANGMPDYTRAFYGADLASQWATDDFYDHSNATPSANDTAVASADGTQYLNWTVVAAETLEISFRRTDDNNRMILRCSQSGSTMKIIEVNAGVENELSSVAQTFTAASTYRVAVRYNGGTVKSWAHLTSAASSVIKNTITGATFNQSATGIKVAGFTNAAIWVAWPYSLSGAVLTELSQYAPSI